MNSIPEHIFTTKPATTSQSQKPISKKSKPKSIPVCPKYIRGERELFQAMFESGEWKDTPNPEKAFYNHFAINSYESIELSSISWINRMPGFSDLSKKKTTFDILNKFRRFHPKIFNFYPRTFMLPEETDEYSDYHETHRKKTFVSKIDSGSQGFGIRILQKPADLPQLFGNSNMDEKVVQEYIDNPL